MTYLGCDSLGSIPSAPIPPERYVATDRHEFAESKLALRASGARDLVCPIDQVSMREVARHTLVEGCGKRATYLVIQRDLAGGGWVNDCVLIALVPVAPPGGL